MECINFLLSERMFDMSLEKGTICAILRGVEPDDAVKITEVLIESGIRMLEVSLSEEEKALKAIKDIRERFGKEVHLGAGTVIHHNQVDKVLEAGATYIITPGWDRELVKYVQTQGVGIFPGVFTPGDIMQAVQEKVDMVKLFPAAVLGTTYIKSLQGPFPNIGLMGVGGINVENIRAYYEAGCTAFAIGGDLVPNGATANDIVDIRRKAEQFIKVMNSCLQE